MQTSHGTRVKMNYVQGGMGLGKKALDSSDFCGTLLGMSLRCHVDVPFHAGYLILPPDYVLLQRCTMSLPPCAECPVQCHRHSNQLTHLQ